MLCNQATFDVFHPLASLEWQECQQLPAGMKDATAVWHGDNLYVGGGWWTGIINRDYARLHVYSPTTDSWGTSIDTPVRLFGLTTYHSQPVLVGGLNVETAECTNKLWTLSEHGQWQETLPPMRTKRHSVCSVSYRDHLLVAGGLASTDGMLNVVEVFNGSHWSLAQPLPMSYRDLKSAILDQHWYLMGGNGPHGNNKKAVHYASLDSLLASCQPSETSQPSSVWKRLTDAPYPLSSTAVFGGRLVAVGGGEVSSLSSSIYAYSFQTNSWIHVGDMPFAASNICSVVLPTGELMVMGGYGWLTECKKNLWKATIKGNLWLVQNGTTCNTHMITVHIQCSDIL